MKRRFCLLLAALLLLTACLSLPVLADEEEHGVMDNVTDVADVLTYDEWSELNARTERMTEEYGCHIVILTWDEIGEGLTADELLDHVFNYYQLGYGPDRSCIMLFLSMEEGIFRIDANGSGYDLLDSEKEQELEDVFFGVEDSAWYPSFEAYLDKLEEYLAEARQDQDAGKDAASGTAAAEPETLDNVTDAAGLLSDAQRQELNNRAVSLSSQYGIQVMIVTVPSIGSYFVEDFTEAVFDKYNLGAGSDRSCIMLLLSMEDRDYDIFAHGYGNYVFTDYGKEKLADKFLPKLGNDDWYGGFDAYLDGCDEFLALAAQGEPVDVNSGYGRMGAGPKTVICLIVAFFPALIAALVMKGKMKTVRAQQGAMEYVGDEGLELRLKEDRFLHRSVSRVRKESSNRGSRSGGPSVNSHGRSHHSGKF